MQNFKKKKPPNPLLKIIQTATHTRDMQMNLE